MRIGFFGGSFDPPHRGHIALARLAMESVGLERVLFAPVGVQPLKRDRPQASFADRVEMTELAIAGEPGLELSLIDAPREDGRPNYTIDTVRGLKKTLAGGDEIFCLMGADSFLSIGKWYRAAICWWLAILLWRLGRGSTWGRLRQLCRRASQSRRATQRAETAWCCACVARVPVNRNSICCRISRSLRRRAGFASH
jgi:cytidyltransferase-like protein